MLNWVESFRFRWSLTKFSESWLWRNDVCLSDLLSMVFEHCFVVLHGCSTTGCFGGLVVIVTIKTRTCFNKEVKHRKATRLRPRTSNFGLRTPFFATPSFRMFMYRVILNFWFLFFEKALKDMQNKYLMISTYFNYHEASFAPQSLSFWLWVKKGTNETIL